MDTTTTTAPETDAPVATYQVVSVPPTSVDAKTQHVVAWARRSTTTTPVKDTERYRGCVVPLASLVVPSESCNSKFHALLQSTIHRLADSRFAAWAKDNMMATAIDAPLLSLDAVLAYWAEERTRAVIDGAKILAWLKPSKTLAAVEPTKRELWQKKLPKIASPAYNQGMFSKADALRIMALIHDDESTDAEAMFIVQRCGNIVAKAEEDEAM